MHSAKCSACGFVGWGAAACKNCGAALVSQPVPAAGQRPGLHYGYAREYSQVKKGLAIWSLAIGVLNLLTLGLLGVGAVLGITLAVIALSKIKNDPVRYGGKELATAGLVTSILSVVLLVPIGIVAAIAIPNLLAARRAANEGMTLQTMLQVAAAQSIYSSSRGTYGTLDELAEERLIDREIAKGARYGYRLRIELSSGDPENPVGFQLVAVPETYPNSGRRSFYLDETGVIRAADARGGEATRFDDPLDISYEQQMRAPTSHSYDSDDEY